MYNSVILKIEKKVYYSKLFRIKFWRKYIMKAYEKLKLNDYMNRNNYLNTFKTVEEIQEELEYIKYWLSKEKSILARAVLELKQIDLEKKMIELKS